MAEQGERRMSVTEYVDEQGWHVVLRGRLDARSVADLRLPLHETVAVGSGPVLLHLGGAEIGDATALGLLVELRRRALRSGRELVVADADPRTVRLLHRARLHPMLAGRAPATTAPTALAPAR